MLELLGAGGMGTVYRVEQIYLGKEFALKLLHANRLTDVAVRRFQLEAKKLEAGRKTMRVEIFSGKRCWEMSEEAMMTDLRTDLLIAVERSKYAVHCLDLEQLPCHRQPSTEQM